MRLIIPFAAALALSFGALFSYVRGEDAAQAGPLSVTQGWARATPPGATVGAAYVTIGNAGPKADRLVRAESPAAGMVMLHETMEAEGVAQMRPADGGLDVPAGGQVQMAPGGLHLMLMDLHAPLKAGATLPLRLVFEAAGDVDLEVPIEPVGAPGPGAADAHMGHGG